MGAIGVEWCANTTPFCRAALREGRSCVSFERDSTIIPFVATALANTKADVLLNLPTPAMHKRKRSEAAAAASIPNNTFAALMEAGSDDIMPGGLNVNTFSQLYTDDEEPAAAAA